MSSPAVISAICFIAGLTLGLFFFGGLRLTLRWITSVRRPALLIVASFGVRAALTVAGFVWVGNGQWQRYVAALVGFVLARLALTHIWAPGRKSAPDATR